METTPPAESSPGGYSALASDIGLLLKEALLRRLSRDLTQRFGRSLSKRNLEQMRRFYIGWPIAQTVSAQSKGPADRISPEAEIKDAYILEFLDLKDEYSENDLGGLPNKVLASEYRIRLPDERALARELRRARRAALDGRPLR